MFTEEATNINVMDWKDQSLNVSELMESWITLPGYPLIQITKDYQKSYTDKNGKSYITVDIMQSRCCSVQQRNNSNELKWIIPLWIRTESFDPLRHDKDQLIWVTEKSQTFTIVVRNPDEYIIANTKMTVYCRITYDRLNWRRLADATAGGKALNPDWKAPFEKLQLLDDAFVLAENDVLDYRYVFQLTDQMGNSWGYPLWNRLLSHYETLHKKLGLSEEAALLEKYVTFLDVDRWGLVSFGTPTDVEVDDPDLMAERDSMIKMACKIETKECLQYGGKVLDGLIATCAEQNFTSCDKELSVHLIEIYICAGMRSATKDAWNIIQKDSATNGVLKTSLTCTQTEWAVAKLVEVYFIPNEYEWLLQQIKENSGMSKLLWDYVIANPTVIGELLDNFNDTKNVALDSIFGVAVSWMTNASYIDAIVDWSVQFNTTYEVQLDISSVQNGIKVKSKWYTDHRQSIMYAIGRMSTVT